MKFCCFVFAVCLLFLQPVVAQNEDMASDNLSSSFHSARRDSLRKQMPDNSVALVLAYPTRVFSNDVDYVYHQNPDLYYFTGYEEPQSLLLIFKENQTAADGSTYNELFFVQKRDPSQEQWTGKRLGVEGVKKNLGINRVYTGGEFKNFQVDFSKFSKILLAPFPDDVGDDRRDTADLYDLIKQFKQKANIGDDYRKDARCDVGGYMRLTGALREVKTEEELNLIRKAVEISSIAHAEVMKAVKPGMSEREVQGIHEFVHKKYGAEEVGYPSIVGYGNNGCILHYEENNLQHIGNGLLLMDVAAEYHGYSADVTRTVPVSGKFSPAEKAIYEIVYQAQEEAFKLCKEGASWQELNAKSREIVADGLMKLGVITKKEESNKYYPHGLSHHIGLDVHDRGVSNKLKKGMVITIEPGIYIPEGSPCDKKWWGIGVRIEDDVLIKEKDYELLSIAAPRKVEDVEKMVAEKSVLNDFKLPPLQSGKKGF